MTTTVQLTDRLPEIIESTWQDVVALLQDYFVENGGDDDCPCLHNDLDHSGAVHELIDSAVPIYNAQLSELAYFHHDVAMAALAEQFGSDVAAGDWPSGPFAAGLYCLIQEGINEKWHEDAEDLWDSWAEELQEKEMRQLAIKRVKQKELG